MTWSIGRYLKDEREARQISIEELSQLTRIPLKTLHQIEDDRFDDLPGDVFARGFVRSYAKALGVDSTPLVEQLENQKEVADRTPLPIASVAPAERGKKFGIAIALAILLILFTLALSIVLRPRHRNVPVELSSAPALFVANANPTV